jgi:hypothetical protein
MELDTLSDKHLQDMERLARELITLMRQAKLKDEPLTEALHSLEMEAAKVRRERFDASHPEYHGY